MPRCQADAQIGHLDPPLLPGKSQARQSNALAFESQAQQQRVEQQGEQQRERHPPALGRLACARRLDTGGSPRRCRRFRRRGRSRSRAGAVGVQRSSAIAAQTRADPLGLCRNAGETVVNCISLIVLSKPVGPCAASLRGCCCASHSQPVPSHPAQKNSFTRPIAGDQRSKRHAPAHGALPGRLRDCCEVHRAVGPVQTVGVVRGGGSWMSVHADEIIQVRSTDAPNSRPCR